MANIPRKLQLSARGVEIGISFDTEASDVQVLLSIQEACDLFLRLGALLNSSAVTAAGKVESAATTKTAIYIEGRELAIITEKNQTFLSVAFPKFPTIKIPVPDAALKNAGNALLQIATMPVDIRQQKTN
jgi:hypothetical protein